MPTSKRTRRAIIYTRVSTDDQAERGYSLRDQEAKLREYCLRRGIEVAAHFQDDYSAKTFERPEFKKLLAYIRTNKGNVDLLLVLKWDRFSRSSEHSWSMAATLKGLGVELQCVEQPVDGSPESLILKALYFAVAEVDNLRRSQATRDGMRRAKLEGRYVTKPPLGYSKGRDETDRPLMRPNEDAPAMREAFEMVASGVYLPSEALLHIRKRGVRCGKSQLYNFLHNPAYAGLIRVDAYGDEPERLVPSLHEALISEQTFWRVQEILDGNQKTGGPRPRRRAEYPLRGHLTCPECGGNLTASSAKGGRYHYYHCQHPCSVRFRAEDAHGALLALFGSIHVAPEIARLYLAVLKDVQDEREGSREAASAKVEAEIDALDEKLTDAAEKLVEGSIPHDAFIRLVERYETQKRELEDRRKALGDDTSDLLHNARYGLSLLADLPRYYAAAGIEAKDRILSSIFPGNLVFEDGAYRTPELAESIRLLRGKRDGKPANDRGPAAETSNRSSKVPETGIEPALP
ncbi:recombinase family protein [Rubrivirga marina]|nr:recombinase family protein [Rubrivirga marina]